MRVIVEVLDENEVAGVLKGKLDVEQSNFPFLRITSRGASRIIGAVLSTPESRNLKSVDSIFCLSGPSMFFPNQRLWLCGRFEGTERFLSFDISESGLKIPAMEEWVTMLGALVMSNNRISLDVIGPGHIASWFCLAGLNKTVDAEFTRNFLGELIFAKKFVDTLKDVVSKLPMDSETRTLSVLSMAKQLWTYVPLDGMLEKVHLE